MIKTRHPPQYTFIDRQGVPMTRARHDAETNSTAYGFVDSNASSKDLTRFLNSAQKTMLPLPNQATMKIRVIEGVNPEEYTHDPDLYEIAVKARECGRITHTIEARARRIDNYLLAKHLGEIVLRSALPAQREGIRLYGGSDGKICPRIVYKQDGEYLDME